ncbi:glucan exo-1,3-beta-glucosidase [Saccharomyces eubayanus]|uniref:glucan exo-1,3-beta-glucosidase n=1 Tax=Saccharomyces eubayanus TaxID=1080349 RepID=UPI0006C3B50C|nr:EXG2-like protein [Saccharomyces eubayanus]KOH01092.1 EXG2-like protein [Saccharomyces eubayanus]
MLLALYSLLAFLVASLGKVARGIDISGSGESLSSLELNVLQNKFASYYTNNSISVKGITIGGWLVTEPYITPSLYRNATLLAKQQNSSRNISIIDEFTLCKTLGYNTSTTLLDGHFKTWITEDDFKQIQANGFNLVRIPIGYWAWKQNAAENLYVDNITYKDPYISDGLQLKYLNQALEWAQKYELNVWIDLHGVPGSQNGFDNSGQRILYGDLGWLRSNDTRKLTLAVWKKMFETFLNGGDKSPVVGLEIVNEPLGGKIDMSNITQMYYEAFDLFKENQDSGDNTTFVIHDAFQGIGNWNLELNPNYRNVSDHYFNLTKANYSSQDILVDHHHYEVFTDYQLAETQFSRIENIINYGNSIHKELPYHSAVVGEWSGAITDCATWLNGVGVGARYDGSYYNTTLFTTDSKPAGTCASQKPLSDWTEDYRNRVRQFIEAQLATYSTKTTGWIFWNWKTEDAVEWDYLKLKDAELFPSPFDNYTYFKTDGSMKEGFSSSLSTQAFPISTTSIPFSTTTTSRKSKNFASSTKLKARTSLSIDSMSSIWKECICISIVAIITFCAIL